MDKQSVPIYSTREEEADLREALDAFVVALAERVDGLQDLESGQAFGELAASSQQLSSQAQELGFGPLAEVAQAVARAAAEDKEDAAREALSALTEVSQRVRLGHRGAF